MTWAMNGFSLSHFTKETVMYRFALAFGLMMSALMGAAHADESAVAAAIEDYMGFTEYGSGAILPEQIPEEAWKNIVVIDARAADQFAREHIPGAVNIEWRHAPQRRHEIPRDRMVVMYCNIGVLSTQSVFALRLMGWDNVLVLGGGIEGWKAKGGLKANALAAAKR